MTLTRFVYKDGDAYAVYYASFAVGHPERGARAIVSLGTWGEGATPEDRLAFPMEILANSDEYQVRMVDRESSPWRDTTFLGRVLDRAESLDHAWCEEVFALTNAMFVQDLPLKDFLDTTTGSP